MAYQSLSFDHQPFLLSQSLVIHWDNNTIQSIKCNQTPSVTYRSGAVSEIDEFFTTVKQLELQTGRIRVSLFENVGNGIVTFYIHPAVKMSMINFEPFNGYTDGLVYVGENRKYIFICFEATMLKPTLTRSLVQRLQSDYNLAVGKVLEYPPHRRELKQFKDVPLRRQQYFAAAPFEEPPEESVSIIVRQRVTAQQSDSAAAAVEMPLRDECVEHEYPKLCSPRVQYRKLCSYKFIFFFFLLLMLIKWYFW